MILDQQNQQIIMIQRRIETEGKSKIRECLGLGKILKIFPRKSEDGGREYQINSLVLDLLESQSGVVSHLESSCCSSKGKRKQRKKKRGFFWVDFVLEKNHWDFPEKINKIPGKISVWEERKWKRENERKVKRLWGGEELASKCTWLFI